MFFGANDDEETEEVIGIVFCDDDDVFFHFIQTRAGEKKMLRVSNPNYQKKNLFSKRRKKKGEGI